MAKPMHFKSVRAYRAALNAMLAKALRGEIPMREVRDAAMVAKTASEMLIAENMMARQGIRDEQPVHHLGAHGGAEPINPIRAIQRRTIRVKKKDANGNDVVEERLDTTETVSARDIDGDDLELLIQVGEAEPYHLPTVDDLELLDDRTVGIDEL